jgi:thioredoxin 1
MHPTPASVTAVAAADFQPFVDQPGAKAVLIDFWAPWCGPCHVMTPVLQQLQGKLGDALRIGKVNVDDNPELARRFNVRAIPTLLLLQGGAPLARTEGARPLQELERWIGEHVA